MIDSFTTGYIHGGSQGNAVRTTCDGIYGVLVAPDDGVEKYMDDHDCKQA